MQKRNIYKYIYIYTPKKKIIIIITHKTVFTWFGNLPTSMELQEFHYSHGKIQSVAVQFFSLKNDIKTLISKITIFISYAQDSQWTTNMGQKNFSWTKPNKISH